MSDDAVVDIQEDVDFARQASEGDYDPWEDYINWKDLRSKGSRWVVFDGEVWEFCKFGPTGKRAA